MNIMAAILNVFLGGKYYTVEVFWQVALGVFLEGDYVHNITINMYIFLIFILMAKAFILQRRLLKTFSKVSFASIGIEKRKK